MLRSFAAKTRQNVAIGFFADIFFLQLIVPKNATVF
jgi:hypothetical protein